MNVPRIALAFALLLLIGCSKNTQLAKAPGGEATGTSAVQQAGVSVRFARIRRDLVRGTTSANGTVVADASAQATLSFPTSGQIAEVYVNVGDRVTAGQTLAALDGRLADRDIAQAQADIDAARAAVARVRIGARPQEVASNASQIRGLAAKADAAQAELRRQESLASAGIAARREVEQARAAYAGALADLQSKQQDGAILRAGARQQDIDVASAQLHQAQAAATTARTRAGLRSIVAPFSGVVTGRFKGAGEVVDSSTPVVTIINPEKSVVEVQLSEDQAALLHPGEDATITINGVGGRVRGTVQTVGANFSSETRTLAARIRPIGAGLIPGASARVDIVTASAPNAMVVPESAIVKDPDTGAPEVFVPGGKAGTYRRIPVRIILQSGSRVAVAASALHEGGQVVSQGAYELLPFAGGAGG